MSEGNIPIDLETSVGNVIRLRKKQTDYDRSTRFIMAFVIFDRKKDINNQFYYFIPNIVFL